MALPESITKNPLFAGITFDKQGAPIITGNDRWTPRRKAAVVLAVREGAIGFDDACKRYNTTSEELSGWQNRFKPASDYSKLSTADVAPLRNRALLRSRQTELQGLKPTQS